MAWKGREHSAYGMFGQVGGGWLQLTLGVSHTWELTMEGGRCQDPSAWPHSSRGRNDVSRDCVPNRLREALQVDKMSRSNKGVGQNGMTRKEWVKGIP